MLAPIPLLKGEPSPKQNLKAPRRHDQRGSHQSSWFLAFVNAVYWEQVSGKNTSRRNSQPVSSLWTRLCQSLPWSHFRSFVLHVVRRHIWLRAWRADSISDCTCPRRRRRNASLTKGRIFRAEFPPIKAACLIPSKLKIKGRLFRSCQPIKLQAKRRTSLFSHSQVDSHSSSQPRRRGHGQVEGFSHIWPVPFGRWTFSGKQELFQRDLGKSDPYLAKNPLKSSLSPHVHLEASLPAFKPKGRSTHFWAQGKLPAHPPPPTL